MPDLKLDWTSISIVKEQIEAAEEGMKLGRTGEITTNSEFTVKWDSNYVTLDIPNQVSF